MKALFGILAALLGIIGIIAGFASGLGVFAYGIYLIILLCKGTIAVSFVAVLKPVLCILGATLVGWLVFFIFAAAAGICAAIAKG